MNTILMALGLTAASLGPQQDCLTNAIYHEARGESYAEQISVGYVVVNRAVNEGFPNTICRVVHQKNQFEFVSNGSWGISEGADKIETDAWERSERIAWTVLSSSGYDSEGALYFHLKGLKPDWDYAKLQELDVGGHSPAHVFYGDK